MTLRRSACFVLGQDVSQIGTYHIPWIIGGQRADRVSRWYLKRHGQCSTDVVACALCSKCQLSCGFQDSVGTDAALLATLSKQRKVTTTLLRQHLWHLNMSISSQVP